MNRTEFVAAVADASSLTGGEVSKVLKAIEDVSAKVIKETGSVKVPGLVTIKRMRREERLVRNPRTGEEFVMGASTLVKAKPLYSFSDRIKEENPAVG